MNHDPFRELVVIKDCCYVAMMRTIIGKTANTHFDPHKTRKSLQRKPSCVHKNKCDQDQLWYSRVLTGWHFLSQHHTYREKENPSVSECIRDQRQEHRWSQSVMGQGVSRHLTRLWVFTYHPPRHSPLKLTLNA